MSSDYVSRLRAELLRAGALEQSRRRRTQVLTRLRPVAVMAAVALLVATVALTVPREGRDEVPAEQRGAETLTYRLPTGDVTEAARIMRARLSAAGIGAEVVARNGTLAITAAHEARAAVTALTAPGRVAIYDWERSVLGPDGRPAPTDISVTGGMAAGQDAELTEAEARSRAAKHPGARAVRTDRGGWFALGDAALTNADVAGARALEDPTGHPVVRLDLTAAGQQAFKTLTAELVRRGAARSDGAGPLQSSQHLGIVLDDRLLSTPFINWREAPKDGFGAADGADLSGLPTPERAQLAAALLTAGPLPAALQPAQG
jgi:preprotein translocase subunit SecD